MTSPTLREALEAAWGFIKNGVALGFIRMPDPDTPDTAHNTLPMIEAALAADAATPSHEAGRRAGLEEAARVAETRHEQWRMPHPDDAEVGEVCCDVSACRDIATAIRNLAGDEGIGE